MPRLSVHQPALALVITLLAGCAATPADPVAPPVLAKAWTQPVPTGPTPVDLRGWWKRLGDPALDALVEEALVHNVDLAIAMAHLRESRLNSSRAAATHLPSLGANAQTLQDISATDTYFRASIDMVWELGLFGAAQSTRDAAAAHVQLAEADEQGVRVAVIADVVRNYLDLQAAGRQLRLQQQLADLDIRSIELAQIRMRAHLGEQAELATARVAAERSQAAQALLRMAMAQAARSLATLLGRSTPDASWSVLPSTVEQVALQPGALAEMPADLVRTRPDVRGAEALVHRAAAAVGLARSALYPRVAIMGSLLYSYNLTRNFRTRDDNLPALGPTLDIPLFDWRSRATRLKAQQEALNAALLGYRRAVLVGVGEAEGALAAYAGQQARAEALGRVWAELRAQAAAGQARHALGLSSDYELLVLRRAAILAQAELLTAKDAQALAYVALYKALGGAPLPAVDAAAVQVGAAP